MNTTSNATWSIAARIIEQAHRAPERPALTVDGETWSYKELLAAARHIGRELPRATNSGKQPVTAIMAQRHFSSYAGILAALLRGHTYVPVNLDPLNTRNRDILLRSGATRIICRDAAVKEMSKTLLAGKDGIPDLKIIGCSERKLDYELISTNPTEQISAEVPAEDVAYILFTSGSTGEPKGVPLTYSNLTGYLDAVDSMVEVRPEDRFSQTFALTFDLSVHDLFVCWTHGAHLIVPTRGQSTKPAAYIRDHRITCWFSVPSLAYQIRLQGELTKDAFPSLRSSLFCGEALPTVLANEWACAAPESSIENWYGPTEATIACARYVMPPAVHLSAEDDDIVPIGVAFPGMSLSVHGEDLSFLPDGSPGELLLSGRQVSQGYLGDVEKTAKSFVKLPGKEGIFYRSGDRVICGEDGVIRFLGRIDNQVKIRGYRVELGAIEAVLRAAAGGHNAIAMPFPPNAVPGRSVVAALEATEADAPMILAKARESLPEYMIPSDIVCLPSFPKNASGKANRSAIAIQVSKILASRADDSDLAVLTTAENQLMDAILKVSPTLGRRSILEAETLIAAGMDSLSFVSLTAEIERVFDRVLDEGEVVLLAELSFKGMVATLTPDTTPVPAPASGFLERLRGSFGEWLPVRWRRSGTEVTSSLSKSLKRRANRAIQFIERFSPLLASLDKPAVIAVGSSGVFRAISPSSFEAAAKKLGKDIHCLNVGLPAVNCQGLSLICAFIRDCCQRQGVRLPVAIYELDPMHLCVLPPKGDIDLGPEFFSGRVASYGTGELDQEFEWRPEARGASGDNVESARKKQRPNWEKKRDYVVARTYLGDVDFRNEAMEEWLEGAKSLSMIADRVICFVHPVNQSMIDSLEGQYAGDQLTRLLQKISNTSVVEIIPWEDFDLDSDDFLNINHVNSWSGAPKLNPQLASFIYE